MRPALSLAAVLVAAFALPTTSCRAKSADPGSIDWVCKNQHDRVEGLFTRLDYTASGLDPVRVAVEKKDYPRACTLLLDYYRHAKTVPWLRMKAVSPATAHDADADSLLKDRFTVYGAHGAIKRTRDGAIDWRSRGPRDDPEWGHALNGMLYIPALLRGYETTGRREYVTRIDTDTRDWILHNPEPDAMQDEGPWRGMDAATRARTWMDVFYKLQNADELSPATRILMLSSIRDHADYLQRFHHSDFTNPSVVEMVGLGTAGCAWPEFHLASMWRALASDQMTAELQGQIYPDGTQAELSSSYQRVVCEQLGMFIDTYRQFGYTVPAPLDEVLERMWNYLVLALRPDGTTPENNDSDRRDIRDALNAAAQSYHRTDWTYVTSHGATGTAPAGGPTVMFPWAGQLIMRSDWTAGAQWAFFDIGAAGTAHQHADKLNLCIDAFGRALLVDSGRYSYANDLWRVYFVGTQAHNTIIIDGHTQNYDALRVTAPVPPDNYAITPQYDFARGTFSGGYGTVRGETTHTRAVLYVRNQFWVVVDRIDTDRPHTVSALWHFAPECHVRIDGTDVLSDDAGLGNLRIIPVSGPHWNTTLVTGATQPAIQGWYSPIFGTKKPETCAVFETRIPVSTTFMWVLVPGHGDVPRVQVKSASSDQRAVKMSLGKYSVTIPVSEGRPVVNVSRGASR